MSRLNALFFCLFCACFQLGARSIQGTVLSARDSVPVTGADCRLTAQGKFITGSTTDASGGFKIDTEIRTGIDLEISMPGFAATSIIIEKGSGNINVGTVYLEEASALGEVTVTASAVSDSRGRTIVYPSGADVKSSSTAISLFQKLPLAGLDANPITRSMTVDGGAPMILINGVPSSMDDVNSLQPKDIEKVEFSRLTPARYADKGTTGFLNITLKKRTDGGQVYLWGRSAVNTAFVDGNLRASYHQGHSQFTLFYNPSWRNYQKVYDNIEEAYIGDDFRVDIRKHDRNPFNYFTNTMRAKYDYSPSDKTLFSATFRARPSTNKSRSIGVFEDSETGEYQNNNLTTGRDFTPSLDLFLRQDFNDNNSLEAQVVGTLSSNDYRRDNRYIYSTGDEKSYLMNVDSRRRSLISEVNYIHDFNNSTQLSAGFQNTISHSTNKYLSDNDYKPVLTENNNYIYARLGKSVGNVYLVLATGAKLFWIKNADNKRNFIRNLSTAQLSWRINQFWNIAGAFRYSPSIPSLSILTDHPQQSTPYLISNGNPDLKVSESFLYQFQASFNKSKFSASFYSAFLNTRNDVIDDVTYLGNRLFLSQSVNARRKRCMQNDLMLKISDIYGFGGNVSLSLTRYESAGEKWSHHLTSFDASFTIWWNKGPFTVSYWRKIPGKYLSGHVVGKDENGDALQLEYQPDKHWTLGASWMYMFDRKGTRYPSWSYSEVNPSSRERFIKNNSNMVVISVSYSADFGSIFRTGRRNLNNSDNSSSLLTM